MFPNQKTKMKNKTIFNKVLASHYRFKIKVIGLKNK